MFPENEDACSWWNNEDYSCFYEQHSSTDVCRHACWAFENFNQQCCPTERCYNGDTIEAECDNHVTDREYANLENYHGFATAEQHCYPVYCPKESHKEDMETALIRYPPKRYGDFPVDECELPVKRSCRQEENAGKFLADSDSFSRKVRVRNIDGAEKLLDVDDLVDMVLKVTNNLGSGDLAEQLTYISKRKKQNKLAAARYRDKQKERKEQLYKEQAELEKKNAELREIVSGLEREVAEYKRKIIQMAADLR